MATILGIGGVFVKSKDPKALAAWYRDMFGIDKGSRKILDRFL